MNSNEHIWNTMRDHDSLDGPVAPRFKGDTLDDKASGGGGGGGSDWFTRRDGRRPNGWDCSSKALTRIPNPFIWIHTSRFWEHLFFY